MLAFLKKPMLRRVRGMVMADKVVPLEFNYKRTTKYKIIFRINILQWKWL